MHSAVVSENLKRVSSDVFIPLEQRVLSANNEPLPSSWCISLLRHLNHSVLPFSYYFRLLLEVGIIDE